MESVILFDGVCNLCNSSVNFIIDHDKSNRFVFASLQSEEGEKILQKTGLSSDYLDSLVLVEGEKVFTKSTAALKIASGLAFPWNLFKPLLFLPKAFRDFFYDIIARNRYNWFGKEDQCRIPTPELRQKFL
ncbi:thiol-disulfide oxidoreductase DCC family protein [Sediminitomix flava]|nr:thiol-disulfide oxidoreductase DCC family protein [Sediminitomix flava]